MKYRIRIEGQIGQEWSDWFGAIAIAQEGERVTLLTCAVADQAALHGLLRKLRDLGLPLISITRLEPGEAAASDASYPHHKEKAKMSRAGSIILSIWSGIHGFLASLILAMVLFFHGCSSSGQAWYTAGNGPFGHCWSR